MKAIGKSMSLNCLADSILTVRTATALVGLSLPALYVALMADEVEDVPAVRPHQRQALHAFLVQVGVLAILEAQQTEPPTEAETWARLLRGLTPEYPDDEPWRLVVKNLSMPALLQPPVPEGKLEVLKECEETPDALDMLVTSKNHDLKSQRMVAAAPEHWFYALLTLQTLEGFLGAGNYGISRMNGGFASRPMIGLAPSDKMGARVRRDIRRLMAERSSILEDNPGFSKASGLRLLWLEPWDGVAPIAPKRLDPFYVEVCRRVRLIEVHGRIVARRATTKAARIDFPKNANGVTGDPWTPIDQRKGGAKALTIDGGGFHYKRVADLLDPQQYKPAPLQRWRQDDGSEGLSLVLTATVRGQGGTDGFHERRIPVPPTAVSWFGTQADALASLAKARIQDTSAMRLKVLRTALYVLFQNAPDKLNISHTVSETKAAPFLAAFDRAVDRDFFEALFAELAATKAATKIAARRKWLRDLKTLGAIQLEAAKAGTPRSSIRRYQAEGAADTKFEWAFRRQFPAAMENNQ